MARLASAFDERAPRRRKIFGAVKARGNQFTQLVEGANFSHLAKIHAQKFTKARVQKPNVARGAEERDRRLHGLENAAKLGFELTPAKLGSLNHRSFLHAQQQELRSRNNGAQSDAQGQAAAQACIDAAGQPACRMAPKFGDFARDRTGKIRGEELAVLSEGLQAKQFAGARIGALNSARRINQHQGFGAGIEDGIKRFFRGRRSRDMAAGMPGWKPGCAMWSVGRGGKHPVNRRSSIRIRHLPPPVHNPVTGEQRQADRDAVFGEEENRSEELCVSDPNLHRAHARLLAYAWPSCNPGPSGTISDAWRFSAPPLSWFRFPLRYALWADLPVWEKLDYDGQTRWIRLRNGLACG